MKLKKNTKRPMKKIKNQKNSDQILSQNKLKINFENLESQTLKPRRLERRRKSKTKKKGSRTKLVVHSRQVSGKYKGAVKRIWTSLFGYQATRCALPKTTTILHFQCMYQPFFLYLLNIKFQIHHWLHITITNNLRLK